LIASSSSSSSSSSYLLKVISHFSVISSGLWKINTILRYSYLRDTIFLGPPYQHNRDKKEREREREKEQ